MRNSNEHNTQADFDRNERLINTTLFRLEELMDYQMTKDRTDVDSADAERFEHMFIDLIQIKAEISGDLEEPDSDYVQDLMAYVEGAHDIVSYVYSAYVQRQVNDKMTNTDEDDFILDLINEDKEKYADFGKILLRD